MCAFIKTNPADCATSEGMSLPERSELKHSAELYFLNALFSVVCVLSAFEKSSPFHPVGSVSGLTSGATVFGMVRFCSGPRWKPMKCIVFAREFCDVPLQSPPSGSLPKDSLRRASAPLEVPCDRCEATNLAQHPKSYLLKLSHESTLNLHNSSTDMELPTL